MKPMFAAFALTVLMVGVYSSETPPKVEIYSKEPGEMGRANTLLCRVGAFQPAVIKIELLKDGVVIGGTSQSDLLFDNTWHFHLIKNVPFTPEAGEEYACRVNHVGKTKTYTWEPNM